MRYPFQRYVLMEKYNNNINMGYFTSGMFSGVAVDFVINRINSHASNDEIVPFVAVGVALIVLIFDTLYRHKKKIEYERDLYSLDKKEASNTSDLIGNLSLEEINKLSTVLEDEKLLNLICDIRDHGLEKEVDERESLLVDTLIDCSYEDIDLNNDKSFDGFNEEVDAKLIRM